MQKSQVEALVGGGFDSGPRDMIGSVTANATATYTTVQLRRIGDVVYLSVKLANSGLSTTHELLASLPAGFRPNVDQTVSIYPPGATTASQNTVIGVASADGKVMYRNNNASAMSVF